MATLGSLDIGETVYDPLTYRAYSTYDQGGSKGYMDAKDCIIWRVIGKNHDGNNTVTLQVDKSTQLANCAGYFDAPEPTNPNSDRVSNGNSRYLHSNILQFLNSDAASNWYTAKHSYDAVTSNHNAHPAFLYLFSTQLKGALQTFTKKTYIPYLDAGNNTTSENVSAKVHLPSVKEIFGDTVNNVLDEGSRYAYYANQSTLAYTTPLRSAKYDGSNIDGGYVEDYLINYSGKTRVPKKAKDAGSTFLPIIVLPASTKISNDKYFSIPVGGSINSGGYALLNMPLVIQVTGLGAFTKNNTGNTKTIKYTIYDDDYAITSLKIAKDSIDNVIYSTTTITKGQEYTREIDVSGYAIDESHKYYFIVQDANGREKTVQGTLTRNNATPDIQIYNGSSWGKNLNILEKKTKPFSIRIKVWDSDNIGDTIYVYFCKYGDPRVVYEHIGNYGADTEIEYIISDDVWKNLDNNINYYWIIASSEPIGESTYVPGGYVTIYMEIETPAPYVEVDSTDVGRKNLGFTINYTPKIDTVQTFTNLSIFLDNTSTLLESIDFPTVDVQRSYEVTKSALYNMSMGTHTLIFKSTDDKNQTSLTNVTFTHYNDAPNVVAEGELGNKNLGFTGAFIVQDAEGDIASADVYIDDTATTPIKSVTNISSRTRVTYEVTKEMLYGLPLGNHNIVVVGTDALGTSTTNIPFVRTNDAPLITGNSELGNVNQPIRETITVKDTESDVFSVNCYIDNSDTPFYTASGITEETDLTYEVTRAMLDDISLGNHVIKIVALDAVGQQNIFTVSFTHYNNSPTVVLSQDETIHNGDFPVKYTVSDTDSDNVYVTFKIGDTVIVDTQMVSSGVEHTQIIPVENIAFGNHMMRILASDKWTMQTPAQANIEFTYNSLPVIEADEVGKVADGFVEAVTVSDTDLDDVNVKVYIDDTIEIANIEHIRHGVPVNVQVTGVTFGSLSYGAHQLNIYAKDSHEQTAEKVIVFEKHSKPVVTFDTDVPTEVKDAFTVTISYSNADGGEVSIKAYIDGQEIDQ